MNQNTRILAALVMLVVIVGVVLGVDFLQRRSAASQAPADMPPGSIPIFANGRFAGSFVPADLEELEGASFVDAEEGKTQQGWLLRDVLLRYLDVRELGPETRVRVSSSSRGKEHTLTWPEIENAENMVLFDLSGRGTLKLVSRLPGFDMRDMWIQDVDLIEVFGP